LARLRAWILMSHELEYSVLPDPDMHENNTQSKCPGMYDLPKVTNRSVQESNMTN
jgi:hypothetical protein